MAAEATSKQLDSLIRTKVCSPHGISLGSTRSGGGIQDPGSGENSQGWCGGGVFQIIKHQHSVARGEIKARYSE